MFVLETEFLRDSDCSADEPEHTSSPGEVWPQSKYLTGGCTAEGCELSLPASQCWLAEIIF